MGEWGKSEKNERNCAGNFLEEGPPGNVQRSPNLISHIKNYCSAEEPRRLGKELSVLWGRNVLQPLHLMSQRTSLGLTRNWAHFVGAILGSQLN